MELNRASCSAPSSGGLAPRRAVGGTATGGNRDEVRLAFGERTDGKIVHIGEVVSGLACACRCCGCGGTLIARKGTLKEHHFAHHGVAPCSGAAETALHRFAKQVLHDRLELHLPEIAVGADTDRVIESKGGPFRFDRAEIEVPFPGFKPDVVLYHADRPLLVEVLVTHATDDIKTERIRAAGLASLEIDLSDLPRELGPDEIAEAVCTSAPRWWLCNQRLDRAQARWEANLAERRARETAAEEQRQQREDERLERLATTIAKTLAEPVATAPPSPAERRINADGLDRLIGERISGDECFACPAATWQAAVVADLILSHAGQDNWHRAGTGRHPSEIFKRVGMGKMLKRRLPSYIDPTTALQLSSRIAFVPPYQVLVRYLGWLAERGAVVERRKRWFANPGILDEVEQRRDETRSRKTRRATVHATVSRIMASLPQAETGRFDLEAWWKRPVNAGSATSDQMLGGEEAEQFAADIVALAAMLLDDGKAVSRAVGLPVGLALRREEQRRAMIAAEARATAERHAIATAKAAALKAEQEAADRVARLSRLARESLGERDAAAWLAASPDGAYATFTTLAASSEQSYWTARDHLDRAIAEQARRATAERLRQALRDKARQSARPDHAHVLLHSAQPRLRGQRPIDYCVDEASFARVVQLLAEVTRR